MKRFDSFETNRQAPLLHDQISNDGTGKTIEYNFNDSSLKIENLTSPKNLPKLEVPNKERLESLKDPSYFNRLKNAIPCFKEFILALYAARYKRDSEYLDCQTEACGSKQVLGFEKASMTITDQFYVCLDKSDTNKVALQK